MKISKKISNFLIYGLGQSINLLSPLIVLPYLIRVCKEEGVGKIGIAFSICLILNCLVDYSSYLQGTKAIAIYRKNTQKLSKIISSIYAYKFILLLVILLTFCLVIIGLPVIKEKKLYLLSLAIVVSQFLNPNWILQGLENFKLISVLNVLSKTLYIGLVYVFVQTYEDYVWANFFLGTSGVLVYFIALLYFRKSFHITINKQNLKRGIGILKKDLHICISEFCLSIYQFVPIIIVGTILGNASAGIYRIIEQIFSVFRTFIFMFFNFSYASVCDEISRNLALGIKNWKQYHLANLGIIALGVLLVFVLANDILHYFNVNETFFSFIVPLLRLALLLPLVLVFSQALRQLLFSLNMTSIYTKIIYLSSTINFLVLCLGIKYYGLWGAFISMFLVEILVIILYIYHLKTNLKNSIA